MNFLFFTMNEFTGLDMHNIYSDLMMEFISHGHRPYIVTPREKRKKQKTELIDYEDYSLLKVEVGNSSECSLIEKGISLLTINSKFCSAVSRYLKDVKFDLILYSTPPITISKCVERFKKKFNCSTYLMLKDIFPQNAVDLGMISNKGLIYRYFRKQEKKLYKISDKIGCMSPANVKYVLKHNPEVLCDKVEICPNAIIPHKVDDCEKSKEFLRKKYAIPDNATVYLYGGNLGKPQGISFLIRCLQIVKNRDDCYFIICGNGSEYNRILEFTETEKPKNIKLISFLPKKEYDELVMGCDIGLVVLDYRFTIPNFPSRLLSYMEYAKPVIVCTDTVSDMGRIVQENGFGLFCESNNPDLFEKIVEKMNESDIEKAGMRARSFLEEHYNAQIPYKKIMGEVE